MVNPLARANMRNNLTNYKIKNNMSIETELSLSRDENKMLKSIIHGEKGVVEVNGTNSIISLEEAVNRIKEGL
jgi:hypothetical protein